MKAVVFALAFLAGGPAGAQALALPPPPALNAASPRRKWRKRAFSPSAAPK